jgi:hypothetical protein
VLKRLKWSQAVNRIPVQTSVNEVYELLVLTLQYLAQLLGAWKALLAFGIGYNNRFVVAIKEELLSTREVKQILIWHSLNLHNECELVHFIFTWEQRNPGVKFRQNAPEAPHINRGGVGDAKDDLWSSVEPRLNVSVDTLILEATASIVNDLYARLVLLLEQDILWLQITVDNAMISLILQGLQDLNGKAADQA